jgi:demethylmenaquinone methyltransferase/2-methoxy-6-polyprenyl-1,4-benzoquinol methylase
LAAHGAEVIGLDFNEPMLAIARRRTQVRQAEKPVGKSKPSADASSIQHETPAPCVPTFVKGDAQQLPFDESTFDVVSVGYGLRNLERWQLGLREMHRVAKPGARLLILDFGKPAGRVSRGLYFGYLRCCVPLLGLAFCGSASAYAYILESLKKYPAQQGVAAEMEKLGMNRVRIVELLGGMMSINYGEKA